MSMSLLRSYLKGKSVLSTLLGSLLVPVILLNGITGCGQQSQDTQSKNKAGTMQPTFQNPVLDSDFPDPGIIRAGNFYYTYATNAAGKNIQVARSSDLVHWDMLSDALPALPAWAQAGGSYVWAPDVIQLGNTYVMYYTLRDAQTNVQCISVAVSDKPEGKFKDSSTKPLICQADQGGSIDPAPFRDGDKLYLYFKNDGNSLHLPTYLWAQELSADGLHVTGKPTQLMHNDKSWQGDLVEAPNMFKHNGKYYLFFSANNYADQTYAVGYALCQSPTGPCEQAAENPILASQMKQSPFVIGPGGQTVFQLGDQTWIIYHAWNTNSDGSRGDSRTMWLDRISWKDDKPQVQGPTTHAQPVPTPGNFGR
ncbi:glycoside hydrolase [Dictyobacter alpinus]|uniref:Glycoside hydrolase n=1 Tax=Dictyobacter alpinus TaxID=2014873 RepID=A0A402BA46_9CHLR|nr:glycoside hydrolase family 43 protein [Dictyobacter alpinus]GCE28196.1 glycoside hydrolase [Dictyobacter alpinus]